MATPTELANVVRHVTDAIDGDGGAAHDEVVLRAAAVAHVGHDRRACSRSTHWSTARPPAIGRKRSTPRWTATTRGRSPPAGSAAGRCGHEPRAPRAGRGDVGNSRAVRPHLSIVADLDALSGATPELIAAVRGEVRTGGLSAATLERISCDCDISRVITSGRSEVLDVGRATRTISAALWKALVVRDRHCTAPGCDQPPERCEGHHRWYWSQGGATNLDNLELLCWYHHRQRHIREAGARASDDSGEISQSKVPASSAFESRCAIARNRSRSGNRCARSPCVPRVDASSCSVIGY